MKQHTLNTEPVVIGASFNGKAIILHLQTPTGEISPVELPTVHRGKPLACMGVLTAPLFEPCVFVAYNADQNWVDAETLSWPIHTPEVRRDLDRAWSDLMASRTPEQAAV